MAVGPADTPVLSSWTYIPVLNNLESWKLAASSALHKMCVKATDEKHLLLREQESSVATIRTGRVKNKVAVLGVAWAFT